MTMDWQPIDTAPKDGTAILLWLRTPMDRRYVVEGRCPNMTIGFNEGNAPSVRWVSIEVVDMGGMGGEETGWMTDWCCIDVEPTHWMPLPKPPKGSRVLRGVK